METVMEAQPSTHYIYPLLHPPPPSGPLLSTTKPLCTNSDPGQGGAWWRNKANSPTTARSQVFAFIVHKTQDTRHKTQDTIQLWRRLQSCSKHLLLKESLPQESFPSPRKVCPFERKPEENLQCAENKRRPPTTL